MYCLELTDAGSEDGLRIEPESEKEFPCVPISHSGEFCLPVDEKVISFLRRVPPIAPIRFDRADFTPDGSLTFGDYGSMALVRLDVRAGEDGHVFLSAMNERTEWAGTNRVMRGYGAFPPVGICVLGPYEEDPPIWVAGAKRIELAITMEPGSSFRVHRTGRVRHLSSTSFVEWTGERLRVNPKPKRISEPLMFQVAAN